jgi:flagellar hook assembly protein FlgD
VSTWTSLGQTSTAFKQVTGLTGATKYDFRVRLSCSGVFTAWSQVSTFTTPSSLVNETGSVDLAGSPTQPQLVLPPAMRIHPNPTRGELNLTYTLYEDSENVSVSIYDLNGRRLETIQMGAQNAGTYQHEFNPLPNSGLFLMRLNSGKSAAMQRFSVIK